MTRRNLADVLRQEVHKEVAGGEPSSPKAITEKPTGGASKSSGGEGSVEEEGSAQTAQIVELKAALAHRTTHEKELQAQIKTLQTEVKRQQKEVTRLETQASQVLQLETELAEAKALILQLSEENTQLIDSLDALQKPKASASKTTGSKTPLALRPLPTHSLQQGSPARSNTSKTVDVGWMD